MFRLLFTSILCLGALNQCAPVQDITAKKKTSKKKEGYLEDLYTKHIDSDGNFRKKGYWDDAGATGKPAIQISIKDQIAYFYKGSNLVGTSPISSGMAGNDTPTGTFRITQKKEKHRSTLYGNIKNRKTGEIVMKGIDSRIDKPGPGEYYEGAPMNYFMRFNGAVGMHTGNLPGYQASKGCVRLPNHMAKKFFENAPHGTIVKVAY